MAVSTIDALYNGTSEKLTTSATGITVTGTVAATAYTGDGSALTGTGSPSIDDNGNATAITIDSNENVGIGTSSPRVDAGTTTLEVSGSTTARAIIQSTGTGGREYGWYTSTSGQFGLYDYTANTERMRIDSTGAVTIPSQPAFLVRPVGYQTNIPNLTTTTVLFGAEVFDQNSDFSSNTFTAPVTGKYQLNFGLRLEQINSASSYYHIHLRTSNRLYAIIFDPRAFDQNPDYWDAGLGALADMDAGDTAHITVFQAFGSAQMDIQGDSYFSGYLVA